MRPSTGSRGLHRHCPERSGQVLAERRLRERQRQATQLAPVSGVIPITQGGRGDHQTMAAQ